MNTLRQLSYFQKTQHLQLVHLFDAPVTFTFWLKHISVRRSESLERLVMG